MSAITDSTSAPAIPESSDDADPVVVLGRQYGVQRQVYVDLDSKATKASRAKDETSAAYLADARSDAYDRELALRDLIASTKATTLAGAAVHIAAALNTADFLHDSFPEKAETFEVKQWFRCIERLLYSALDVVDTFAAVKLADVVDTDFSSPHRSPWVNVDLRLARIMRETTPTVSPLMARFEEWNRIWDKEKGAPDRSDEAVAEHCRVTDEAMEDLLALPASTAQELAAKLMCFTHYGAYQMDSNEAGIAILKEAAALAGHPERFAGGAS